MKAETKSRVQQVLEEIQRFTAFGGIYFSFAQPLPPVPGKSVCRFCDGCLKHPRAGSLCQNSAYAAAVQAFSIGDVWFCRCWLGVDCVVIPVAPEDEIAGAIEIGGFYSPGESEKTQQKILSLLASLDSGGTLEHFVSGLQGMREIGFMEVRAAADFVLEATFTKGLNQASLFGMRRKIYRQQQRLSQKIPLAPIAGSGENQLLTVLFNLVSAGSTANWEQVRHYTDDFLSQLLVSAQGELPKIKAGSMALLGLLTFRHAQKGTGWHTLLGDFEEKMIQLEKLRDPQAICSWVENLVLPENPSGAKSVGPAGRTMTDRVAEWLRGHYAENIRLNDAAKALGASRSTIIHHLKEETGKTFGGLLQAGRLSEAKRLLAFTTLSVGEISFRCGFKDQSYFTKVFRREINLTPREFRRLLTQVEQAETR